MTDVGVTEVESFLATSDASYPVLADAAVDREAWGVDLIWGSTIYLVQPDNRIVASGITDIESALAGSR